MDSQADTPRNLKLSAISSDTVEGTADRSRIAANLQNISRLIMEVDTDTRLIVLPEMFSTGFTLNPQKVAAMADTNDGIAMTAVRQWAAERNAAVCGSFLATDNCGGFFNRAFFTKPSGETLFYDKRHLFGIGGETRIMTAGRSEAPIAELDGWRIKMSVCYDLRFPVWNRRIADTASDYDMLVIPANWPEQRRFAWEHLLIARAIENQAYVAGVNRSGSDKAGSYAADSTLIIDPWGKATGEISLSGSNAIVSATLSGELLAEARKGFPVWRDADRFTITL